jgi:hypothetical protein
MKVFLDEDVCRMAARSASTSLGAGLSCAIVPYPLRSAIMLRDQNNDMNVEWLEDPSLWVLQRIDDRSASPGWSAEAGRTGVFCRNDLGVVFLC